MSLSVLTSFFFFLSLFRSHYISIFEEVGFVDITTYDMPCDHNLAYANKVLGIDIDKDLPSHAPERNVSPVLLISGRKQTIKDS